MPTIQFAATQFSEPVTVWAPAQTPPQDCTLPITSNSCSQIVLQKTQTTELVGQAPWTPGTPITILGTGFGYLTNSPGGLSDASLPYATSPQPLPYVLVSHCPSGAACPPYDWDTNSTLCQAYIANWTDTNISLIVSLPPNADDGYGILLSPLTDVSPMTFGTPPPTPPAVLNCPVAAGDTFTLKVTNPQGGAPVTSPAIPVSSTGTTLH